MAFKKEIELNVKVTGKESVSELNGEINKTSDSVDKTSKSTDGLASTLDKFTGGAITRIKGFTSSLSGLSMGFKGVGVAIAASGIGLIILAITAVGAAFKGSEEGQNKFAKLMGVIGSVVGNVIDVLSDLGEFIIDLFSGDGAAMTKLKSFGKSIFNVIGLPIKNVIDTVKSLGKALGALFSGDISGAFDELQKGVADVKQNFDEAKDSIIGAKDALVDFAKEVAKEAVIAQKIADDRAKADVIERDLIVERAEANRKIAELRDKAAQREKFSAEERKQAIIDAGKISEEITNKEIKAAILRRDAIVEENKLSKSGKEDKTAEAEATAKVIDLETARLKLQKSLSAELVTTSREQSALASAAAKERQTKLDEDDKKEKDRLKNFSDFKKDLIEKDRDNDAKTEEQKLELERTRAEEKLSALITTEEEKREALIILNEFYNQKEDELAEQRRVEQAEKQSIIDANRIAKEDKQRKESADKQEKERKKTLRLEEINAQSKVEITQKGFEILGALAERGSALGKAVAVSQAVMSTYQGINKALAETTDLTPTQSLRFANAAAVGIMGFLNVSKILSTKTATKSAGGASAGGQAPSAPSFNLVEGSGTNQIAQGLQSQDEPVRAYVVSGDVTTSQSLERNIQGDASLG